MGNESAGASNTRKSLKPYGWNKKNKNQEAKAAQDTSGRSWMHTGQRAAHSAGTVRPRGTETLVGSMLVGRPEARNKGRITDSCSRQRQGAPLPLMRLKRKWLQKCWVKLSQKQIKAC